MSLYKNATLRQRQLYDQLLSKPPPGKRDFQDHNPPKTAQELYERYDPSTGMSTVIVLGSMLVFIILRISMKHIRRATRKRLSKSKVFGKYFPVDDVGWPPLHVAERIAMEEGMQLPKSLVLKLSEHEGNLHKIVHDSRCHAWVTAAIISPLAVQTPIAERSRRPSTPLPPRRPSLIRSPHGGRYSLFVPPTARRMEEAEEEDQHLRRLDEERACASMSKLEMEMEDGRRPSVIVIEGRGDKKGQSGIRMKETIVTCKSTSLDDGWVSNVYFV